MFPMRANQNCIALPSSQTIMQATTFCAPLSVDPSVKIRRFFGPFNAMVFSVTECCSDEKALLWNGRIDC